MLDFAIRAAREAGAILNDYQKRGFVVTHKGAINLVTEADHASEALIKGLITSHYPEHRILAEESGASETGNEYCWLIDPLDGTTNFAHGLPCYAVSIGLEYRGEMVLGVIYDPTRDDLFAAERGAGAHLNGVPIRVSQATSLEKSLLVTGFPYDVRERMDYYMPAWEGYLTRAQGVRRLGAAAIDMAYVACGRLDGFWEFGLHPWDTAAGWILIEEAGGRVTQRDGSPFNNFAPSLIASNTLIHDEMLDVVRGL
jgi:myo-inositol-1(or 4)-monophosphatase